MRRQGLGLAVEKVIHHDAVIRGIIIWPWGDGTGGDPHPGDARVVKHDPEERQGPITGRGRNDPAEEQLAVSVPVLQPLLAPGGVSPSGSSTSVNTAPKPLTVAGVVPLEPGTKNHTSVRLLPAGVNRRNGLKGLKMVA